MSGVTILLLYFFIFSCGHEDDIKPVVDYRCKVTTRSAAERIYCNTPVPIAVTVEKKDPSIGTYKFSYTILEGNGEIFIGDNKLPAREEMPINLNNFTPQYVPTKLGEHKLKFRFENEEYVTESLYVIQANDLVFEAAAVNLPQKLLIDKPFAFDLQLKQKNESSDASEFNAQLQILKGKGYVTFIGAEDSTTLMAFSLKSDSVISNITNITKAGGIPTKAISDYKVKVGNNKVHFKSGEEGENVLLLSVENEWGYQQDLNVPLTIELPEFSVHTTADSTGSVGTINNFLLNIEDTDNFGENIYNVTYRNITNSGKLKINNNEIQVGATLQLMKGDNVCEFIPNALGETALEFIVKDKYNTTHKDTVRFNSVRSYVNILVSDYDTVTTISDTRTFSFAVDKKDYTGKYYLDLSQNPLGTASVKINGADYIGGRLEITNKQNTLIGFVPKKTGNLDFILKVYDDYNSESRIDIPFIVKNSAGNIFVSNQKPAINIFSETSFNFGISKPNYSGSFQYEIILNSASSIINNTNIGTLKVDGKEYQGGRTTITNIHNTTVSFLPKQTGEVRLTLNVYDDFAGMMSEEIVYSVNNTDIKLSVVDLSKNLLLSKETYFTFTPSKPFYEGNLTYTISMEPATAGILRVDDQSYMQGGIAMVSNNSPVKVSFIPGVEGNANLLLKVYDEWGSIAKYPLTYNVTNPPITISDKDFKAETSINTENSFSISVNKPDYSDGYNYSISTSPSNAGEIKVNGVAYSGGTDKLPGASNTKISFIPKVTGEITLTLTISDNLGGKIKREYVYKADNPDISLAITNIEDNLTLNKKSSFLFLVSKPNYSGKYFYEIESRNAGHIFVENIQYTSGKKIEISNPLGTTVSFIPEKVGQDTVKLHLKVYDEWGKMAVKDLSFSVTNSNTDLRLADVETTLFTGKETSFNFTAEKPDYEGKLNYEIKAVPSDYGTFKIKGKDYISGQFSFNNGETIPVTFKPSKEGIINVKVTVSDEFGGEKSSSFNYTITSTSIVQEFTDYTSEAVLNTEKVFTMALSKLYYDGSFNYSITTQPSNCGKIKVNDTEYTGGKLEIADPANTKISFTPTQSGELSMTVNVSDNIGGKNSKTLHFKAVNNPINIYVNNQSTGVTIDKETSFNFAVQKIDYSGKFQYEIITDPVVAGTFRINNKEYKGGRTDVVDIHNTQVFFTPGILGDVQMKLRIYDDFGGIQDKDLSFSISNSEFVIHPSNQEKDIYNGVATNFNFSVLKPYYSGKYKYEIIQTPEGAGDIMVNGSAYRGGKADLTSPVDSKVEYTSHTNGLNTLTIKVYDEHGSSTQENIIFNSISSPIDIRISNKEDNLIFNTATAFNAIITKDKYKGTFDYEIEQIPANSGIVTTDGQPYNGGIAAVNNPDNLLIGFTPTRAGHISLKLTISDKIGGKTEKLLEYDVVNPEIKVNITNQIPDILVNTESSFNFNVSKANYTGNLYYQITQEPAGSGVIKTNGKVYTGVKTLLSDLNNNTVSFTANKPGAVTLSLTVTDEWGKENIQLINYSVSNTDIKVNITEKEYDLSLNKATNVKFNVSKPNYTGSFSGKVLLEPEDGGTVKINNVPYHGKEYIDINPTNTIEFLPTKTGATLLKIIVKDEHNGEKEVAVNYKVVNPAIQLNITNRETNLTYNTPTSFNASVTKAYYNGGYDFQIEQLPAASGSLTVDNKAYNGGIQAVTNPRNILVGFKPTQEGRVTLKMKVTDKVGGEVVEMLDFNVMSSPIELTLNGPDNKTISIGQSASFTIKAAKKNYTGSFNYEITPHPVDCGSLTVNGKTGLTGALNPNPTTVNFTPTKLGTAIFTVKVTDTEGKSAEKNIDFSVENTPISISFANNESNVVLNTPTNFVFKVTKANYPESKNITYTVSPAYTGTLTVDGKAYTGTSISIPYSKIKNGINVQYSPDREGEKGLTFTAEDEFGGMITKSLIFSVSNPELKLFLTGVNTGGANEANLGSTYKFYYNINKAYYKDAFAYWITLDPQAAGIVGTSDATPRSARSGGGVDIQTGTIQANPNGATTGEIRFTPSSPDYLNKEVTVNVRVRDKWNNEKEQTVRFKIVTSAIEINVNRKTSIDVEKPYSFYFTVNKPGYSGKFKYQLAGWADGDKLEVSANNSSWTTYNGGKFDLPSKDHTYIRYTPAAINTIPLRLFVYDDQNGEAMQELTFDVKAPEVKLSADATTKEGYLNEFVPFNLTATEDKGENVNVSFSTNEASFSGELRFNGNAVTPSNSRMRAASSSFSISSGSTNKLEIKSFNKGKWGITTTATNRWNQSASVTTSVQVSDIPYYTLTTSHTGEGDISVKASDNSNGPYKEGTDVTLTAIPASGWKFVKWTGDASGTSSSVTVTMNSDKNVQAVFEVIPEYESTLSDPVTKTIEEEIHYDNPAYPDVYRSYGIDIPITVPYATEIMVIEAPFSVDVTYGDMIHNSFEETIYVMDASGKTVASGKTGMKLSVPAGKLTVHYGAKVGFTTRSTAYNDFELIFGVQDIRIYTKN